MLVPFHGSFAPGYDKAFADHAIHWPCELKEEMLQEEFLHVRWAMGVSCSISVRGSIAHNVEFGGDYRGLGPRRWING